MVGLSIITACAILLSVGMAWRIWRLQQNVGTFADRLEQYLDDMIDGKEPDHCNIDRDTLWCRVQEKLQRVNQIWRRKETENFEEKQRIKELISDISHQTRTPIANIKLYLEILQGEPMSEKGHAFLQKVESQTGKLDFLLQSMVKMSRLETGVIQIESRKENLVATLRHAMATIVPKAERKQIQLFMKCPDEILIRHDQKWTEEAIFNILDNAVKYTDIGGSIRIAVSIQEIFIQISVRDSGKGIAPERQAEIFTRFYREPEVHDQEGIGVGLYLARKIVELQKGYIEVRSEVNSGAEFRICLPRG